MTKEKKLETISALNKLVQSIFASLDRQNVKLHDEVDNNTAAECFAVVIARIMSDWIGDDLTSEEIFGSMSKFEREMIEIEHNLSGGGNA